MQQKRRNFKIFNKKILKVDGLYRKLIAMKANLLSYSACYCLIVVEREAMNSVKLEPLYIFGCHSQYFEKAPFRKCFNI